MTNSLKKLKEELLSLPEDQQDAAVVHAVNTFQNLDIWENLAEEKRQKFLDIAEEARQNIKEQKRA